MKQTFLSVIIFILFCACNKDKNIPLGSVQSNRVDTADFTCRPYYYFQNWSRDSDITAHCVYYWEYNPTNINTAVYQLTNGQIWSYNFLTTQRIFLGDQSLYLFAVNRKGWVIFNKLDANIYKVKSNGDSLTQLTFEGAYHNPQWDYTDTAIYAFRPSPLNYTVKLNAKGKKLDSIPGGDYFYAYSRLSNRAAFYALAANGKNGLYIKDFTANNTTLIAERNANSGEIVFDNNDEWLYVAEDSTLMRYNIVTHSQEFLYKNCPNNSLGGQHISLNTNKITFGWEKTTALIQYRHCYLHEYRSFEFDLANTDFSNLTSKLREVKIYP